MSISKKEVTKTHQERFRQISAQNLIIYTDESDHNGHIGAAIYSSTCLIIKDKYMNTDDIHIIYAAELMTMQMIIILFEGKISEYVNVHIFMDN